MIEQMLVICGTENGKCFVLLLEVGERISIREKKEITSIESLSTNNNPPITNICVHPHHPAEFVTFHDDSTVKIYLIQSLLSDGVSIQLNKSFRLLDQGDSQVGSVVNKVLLPLMHSPLLNSHFVD